MTRFLPLSVNEISFLTFYLKKLKSILVLTLVYPAQDMSKTVTPVVHYFTCEWLEMGYDVRVVHYSGNFQQ